MIERCLRSPLGLGIARLLASRGASLSLADANKDGLEAARIGIAADFDSVDVVAQPVDVRDYGQVETWIAETISHFGRLDGAANIAGVIPKSIHQATLADQDADEWEFLFAVNVTGVMHSMKAQLRVMRAGGSIVNACSIAGVTGRAQNACYSATKHAVLGLTRSAAKEFGAQGVRVNCICPGRITTPMLRASQEHVQTRNDCAMDRPGEVEEVAKPVAFLLSDEASYISGVALGIDGG